MNFLTDRTQIVKLAHSCSSKQLTNTGAPQGTVLAPVLFTYYTNLCKSSQHGCVAIKYADDMALVGKIEHDIDSHYRQEVQNILEWCQKQNLLLNVSKTKELIIDPQKRPTCPLPVFINGNVVDIVESFKYLGITIDNCLTWKPHVDKQINKTKSSGYLISRIRCYHPNPKLLATLYYSLIESVLMYALPVWWSSCCKKEKAALNRVTRYFERMIQSPLTDWPDSASKRTKKLALNIMSNPDHALAALYNLQHRGHLRSVSCRTNRLLNTFIPASIRLFNSKNK
jgi:hypothetical protein